MAMTNKEQTKSDSRQRPLLVLAALAGIVLAAWLGRAQLERWTRGQLAARQQRHLAQLPEAQAAELTARLASADDEYLDIVVLALADRRPLVAEAGEQALIERVELWSQWPASEAGPRVAALADLLARSHDRLPSEKRALAQRLAERLLTWPVDGRTVDSLGLIANCEQVLRLPPAVPEEIRIAEREPPAGEPAEMPAVAEPAPSASQPEPLAGHEPPAAAVELPPVVAPLMPRELPDASRESPSEPRRFLPPRARRVSDDE
jgi:hypothetical protein